MQKIWIAAERLSAPWDRLLGVQCMLEVERALMLAAAGWLLFGSWQAAVAFVLAWLGWRG